MQWLYGSFCLKCPEWLPPTSLFPDVEAAEAETPVAMFPQWASVYCLLLHYPKTQFWEMKAGGAGHPRSQAELGLRDAPGLGLCMWHKLTPPWKGTVLGVEAQRPGSRSTLTTLPEIQSFLGEKQQTQSQRKTNGHGAACGQQVMGDQNWSPSQRGAC